MPITMVLKTSKTLSKRTAILFGVLATLMASYLIADYVLPHTGTPERVFIAACVANLKAIATAKAQWAIDEHKTTNDAPTWPELVGTNRYLAYPLECAKGGTYAIGTVGEPPTCTLTNHKL